MNKQISLILILIFSCLDLFAQTENAAAPVKWERYKVSEQEISIELPKLPVKVKSASQCSEIMTEHYAVYAEESVYQFTVASKSRQKIPGFCTEKERFTQKTFESRIEELRKLADPYDEKKTTINEREVTKLSSKNTTRLIFDDMKNGKWLELSITNREDIALNEDRFVKSVEFGKNTAGIEIGNGVLKTLGDEENADETKTENVNEKFEQPEKMQGLKVVFKPRANYTDAARQGNIQGTVTLRVTFLANGGIGNISPISALPYGLTEQAIASARKIVFLPPKRNGKTFNAVAQVQYAFTIY
jgi:TonB family protein